MIEDLRLCVLTRRGLTCLLERNHVRRLLGCDIPELHGGLFAGFDGTEHRPPPQLQGNVARGKYEAL